MNDLQITEYKNIRVLTTQQIAEAYGSDTRVISNNFNRNNSVSLRSIGLVHLSAYNGNPVRFTEEIQEIVDCDVDVWVAEKGTEKEFRLMPF